MNIFVLIVLIRRISGEVIHTTECLAALFVLMILNGYFCDQIQTPQRTFAFEAVTFSGDDPLYLK